MKNLSKKIDKQQFNLFAEYRKSEPTEWLERSYSMNLTLMCVGISTEDWDLLHDANEEIFRLQLLVIQSK